MARDYDRDGVPLPDRMIMEAVREEAKQARAARQAGRGAPTPPVERVVKALEGVPVRDDSDPGGELDRLRLIEAARAAISALGEPTAWHCASRSGGGDPTGVQADCDWPVCGCDPYADKVIAALQESGLLRPYTRPVR